MSKIDWTKRHDPDASLFNKIIPALIGAIIAAVFCLPFGFATGWASGRVANVIVSDCPPCPDEMEVRGHNKKLENIIWDCQAHMQLCKWAKKSTPQSITFTVEGETYILTEPTGGWGKK